LRRRFVGVFRSGTWAYKPTAREWEYLAGAHLGTFSPAWRIAGGLVLYDPVADQVIAVAKSDLGRRHGIYLWDNTAQAWTETPIPFPSGVPLSSARMLYASYDPLREEFYILSQGHRNLEGMITHRLWRYRPANHTFGEVTSLPAALRTGHPAFDFDTRNRKLVFLIPAVTRDDGLTVVTWDPDIDVWTEVPQTSSPTGRVGRVQYRKVIYVPEANVFIFLGVVTLYCNNAAGADCGGRNRTWAYRLK
jgi:hypothetical protein